MPGARESVLTGFTATSIVNTAPIKSALAEDPLDLVKTLLPANPVKYAYQ
jgi:hypothetical protein